MHATGLAPSTSTTPALCLSEQYWMSSRSLIQNASSGDLFILSLASAYIILESTHGQSISGKLLRLTLLHVLLALDSLHTEATIVHRGTVWTSAPPFSVRPSNRFLLDIREMNIIKGEKAHRKQSYIKRTRVSKL